MAIAQVEDITSVRKKILITLPKEDVQGEIQKALINYAKRAQIKGFRPGKAPLQVVERLYGNTILQEVRQKVIEESLDNVVSERGFRPVGVSKVDGGEIIKGEDYSFVVDMEIRPKIELPEYKGMELTREVPSVTHEMVEERLKELQRGYATLEDIEEKRPVGGSDHVVVDCSAIMVGDKEVKEEKRTVTIDLSAQEADSPWREALIGKSLGERGTVTFKMGEDHPKEDLRGKDVTLEYEIKAIKRLVIPELNDDFARRVSNAFSSVEDLKQRLRELALDSEKKRVEAAVLNQVIDRLLEKVEFEVPECLVEMEISAYIQSLKEQMQASGAGSEMSPQVVEGLEKSYRPRAIRNVKELLLLGEIAEKEGITVEKEDLINALRASSSLTGQSLEAILDYYESRDMMHVLRYKALRDKTLRYLLDHATIHEAREESALSA